MKRLLIVMLLMGASVLTCAAQRHPYSSRPYHPPDRQQPQRDTRRATPPAPKPQPVSSAATTKPEPKRGK